MKFYKSIWRVNLVSSTRENYIFPERRATPGMWRRYLLDTTVPLSSKSKYTISPFHSNTGQLGKFGFHTSRLLKRLLRSRSPDPSNWIPWRRWWYRICSGSRWCHCGRGGEGRGDGARRSASERVMWDWGGGGGDMGQWWVLGAYFSLCPLLLTLLLCGDRPIFKGTFVESAHDFLTGGACDLCQWVFVEPQTTQFNFSCNGTENFVSWVGNRGSQ